MIGSSGSVTSRLASIYAFNTRALNDSLTRLSSGKKFQNLNEDFSGFLRSSEIGSEISSYRRIRENLTEFKTFTSAALLAGNSICEDLTRLKTLANQYNATSDNKLQTEYEAEFNSLKIQISKALNCTFVDGNKIMQSTVSVTSVNITPNTEDALELLFSDVADDTAIASMAINGETIETDIDTEIRSMMTYISEAKAFQDFTDQQLKFNESIIKNKENLRSVITDIYDATEIRKAVDLAIRQDASIAMIAQGNMMQSSLSVLYKMTDDSGDMEEKVNDLGFKKAIMGTSMLSNGFT